MRSPRWSLVIALLAVLSVPATAGAQWIARPFHSMAPPRHAVPAQDATGPVPRPGRVIGFAALGGVAGAVAGFAVGYPLLYLPDRAADLKRGCEDCGLGGALGTAALMVAGETIGVAVGAYLGNDRRGRFGTDLMTSIGALALGAAIAGGIGAVAGGTPTGLVALTIPMVQIGAMVIVERGTAGPP